MPKTCENLFYKNVTVVLCKKPLEKTHNIQEKKTIMKSGHLAKAIAHAKEHLLRSCRMVFRMFRMFPCKGYSLGKKLSLGQKLKMPKTSEKRFYNNVTEFLCKNR